MQLNGFASPARDDCCTSAFKTRLNCDLHSQRRAEGFWSALSSLFGTKLVDLKPSAAAILKCQSCPALPRRPGQVLPMRIGRKMSRHPHTKLSFSSHLKRTPPVVTTMSPPMHWQQIPSLLPLSVLAFPVPAAISTATMLFLCSLVQDLQHSPDVRKLSSGLPRCTEAYIPLLEELLRYRKLHMQFLIRHCSQSSSLQQTCRSN